MNYKLIVTPGNNSALIKKVLLNRGNWEVIQTEDNLQNQILKANFVWSPNSLALRFYSIIQQHIRQNPNKIILLNHFQNHRIITTKVNLIRSLRNYYSKQQQIYSTNYSVFLTTPTTFIITIGNQDNQYQSFSQRYYELQKGNYYKEKIPAKHCKQNLWLVKPANLNQGRGIQIFRNIKQISNFLTSKPLNTIWVVQKYIEKPLLYHGRKFDIRVWVIITNKNEVYYYQKGYIRTSSDFYSMQNFNNYVHLTNNCLQKYGSGYSKFQQGNTLPLQILQQYINSHQKYKHINFNLNRDIVTRIKDIIIDTAISGKRTFNTRRKQFQLFGYDFLVDQDLRTWLIEVNTNPYLGVPNDYIKDLLNIMIDDMLKLVVDPLFPPKNKNLNTNKNLFELIYSEQQNKNVRSPFSKSVYFIEQFAQPSNKNLKKGDQITQNEQKKVYKQYNVQQHIKILMQTASFIDFQVFHKPVSHIIGNILNWQLHTEQFRNLNCKLLKLLAQSKFNAIFADQKNDYIQSLVKVIDSQNFPTEIQITVIQSIIALCKNISTKKKVISPILITSLVKIGLTMFNQKQYKQFDKNLIKLSIKCLISLAGVYQFKYFIPGETRENQAMRQLFIKYHGLCILLLALNQQNLKNQIQQFLQKLDINDWEYQLNLLKVEGSISTSAIIQNHSYVKTKLLQRMNKGEETIQYTAPQIQRHKDQLIKILINKIAELRLKNLKKEQQFKEKKQKFELFQQKLKQQKQKVAQERKIKAEQYMKKKNSERAKLKLQEEKKMIELKIQQEQRKKKIVQQIQKRRQEIKIIRNDSKQKVDKDERQKTSQKERKKQKYTTQQRNRILSDWLQSKKEQQRKKKEVQKQEELKKIKLMEEKKIQIQKRIIKLKQKNNKRKTSNLVQKTRQQTDITNSNPKILLDYNQKSRFPIVPKSEKRAHNLHIPYQFNDSDQEQQKPPHSPIKYQSQQKKAFKYFLNAIKKAATKSKVSKTYSNQIDLNQNLRNQIKDHKSYDKQIKQIKDIREPCYSVQEQILKKNHKKTHLLSQQVSRKHLQKSHTNNTEDKQITGGEFVQNMKKKETKQNVVKNQNNNKQVGQSKDKSKVIMDFLMSSPYSSFVRRHYKVKQLLQQISKNQNEQN